MRIFALELDNDIKGLLPRQKYIEQLHEDIKEHQDKCVNLSVQLRLSEERIRSLEEQIEKGESLWHKLRKHVNWK